MPGVAVAPGASEQHHLCSSAPGWRLTRVDASGRAHGKTWRSSPHSLSPSTPPSHRALSEPRRATTAEPGAGPARLRLPTLVGRDVEVVKFLHRFGEGGLLTLSRAKTVETDSGPRPPGAVPSTAHLYGEPA
jgi:hypothetical protein